MRGKLPPIFSRVRFSLPKQDAPPIIISLNRDQIEVGRQYIKDAPSDVDLQVSMWAHAWIETPHLGMLCYSRADDSSEVTAWNAKGGKPVKFHFAQVLNEEGSDLFKVVKAQFYQAVTTIHILTEQEAEVSVNTKTRNKPSAWLKQGDTIRYAPISSLASTSRQNAQRGYVPPEQPSGIKMREHDVRGHWRTYSSGIRVWVRSHKRGDPELGRVTRVIGASR